MYVEGFVSCEIFCAKIKDTMQDLLPWLIKKKKKASNLF